VLTATISGLAKSPAMFGKISLSVLKTYFPILKDLDPVPSLFRFGELKKKETQLHRSFVTERGDVLA
jgi:hypothetical protein